MTQEHCSLASTKSSRCLSTKAQDSIMRRTSTELHPPYMRSNLKLHPNHQKTRLLKVQHPNKSPPVKLKRLKRRLGRAQSSRKQSRQATRRLGRAQSLRKQSR